MNKHLFILALFCSFTMSNHDDIILIPHSHDDLGWNWTVMEYYNDRVRSIFDTTIQSLLENPKRKFVYSEVGYLKIYLNENPATRDTKIANLKKLMANGQWEFVNGGISQSDEACPYYEDIMENFFYGLSYLKNHFQTTSVAGWQIDPFGHSWAFAYFVKLFGIDDLVINRIPQVIRDELERNLERKIILNWKLPGTAILTHLSINHYSSPQGMDCNGDGDCDFSKFDRFKTDVFFAQRQQSFPFAQWYLHGNDFCYPVAQNKFEFTEKVMELYDHMQYGLFTDYLKTVDRENIDGWYLKDFMVYQEGNKDAWSGYYTTKPDLKRRIRMLGRMLRNFKLMISQIITDKSADKSILDEVVSISEDFGVFLHHDCITGTAKRYVDEDYFTMMDDLEKRMMTVLGKLIKDPAELLYSNEYADLMGKQLSSFKNLLKGQTLKMHIFNGYVQKKQGLLEFVYPLLDNLELVVEKELDGSYQRLQTEIQYCYNKKCMYTIKDDIDPIDLNVYQLSVEDKTEKKEEPKKTVDNDKFLGYTILEKDNYILMYNDKNEIIFQIGLWKIKCGKSGAYILKYNEGDKYEQITLPQFTIQNNELFDKLVIQNDEWTWTLKGETYNPYLLKSDIVFNKVEMFTEGIDFVMSVESSLIYNTENKFITDSNGFLSMEREVVSELEISVFPMNLFTAVKDSQTNNAIGFFSSFSHGVTLHENKRMMIYLQRSTTDDDHKGVDQNVQVNDSFVVSNWIFFSDDLTNYDSFTYYHQVVNYQPLIYYGKNPQQNIIKKQSQQLQAKVHDALRVNVDYDGNNNIIVRFQSLDMQKQISVNLKAVLDQHFAGLEFKEFDIGKHFNPKRQSKIEKDITAEGDEVIMEPFEFKYFMASLNGNEQENMKVQMF